MAIALDQAVVCNANSTAGDDPTNFTTTASVAAGATVVLVVHSNLSASGVTVGGVAATLDKSQTNTDTSAIWRVHLPSGLGSGGTIAIDFAAPPNLVECNASSFSGVLDTSPLDQTNSKSTFNTQSWSSSSITPTVANTLVVGYYRSGGAADARSTPDAGWTEAHDVAQFGNVVMQYQVVSDTTARNPSGVFATSQSGADQIGITVNYREGSAPPAATPQFFSLLGIGG